MNINSNIHIYDVMSLFLTNQRRPLQTVQNRDQQIDGQLNQVQVVGATKCDLNLVQIADQR